MALFSSVQRRDIVNQFWNDGRARCPHDGTMLDTHFHRQADDYLLVMACMHCGRKSQVTRYSDPDRREFRPWNLEDILQLLGARRASMPAVCPVCQTGVRPRHLPERPAGVLECLRCGNQHDAAEALQSDAQGAYSEEVLACAK